MNNELLIAQNEASSSSAYSAVSTPTFPYSGPFELSSTSSTASVTSSLVLVSDNQNPSIGDTFKVSVTINSSTTKAKSYKINLTYDPSLVEVIDSNNSKAGVNVNILDTFFKNTINSVDTQTGSISIEATTTSAVSVNRKVAEISFKALNNGSVVIGKDSATTNVVASDNSNISLSYNAITIQVGSNENTQSSTDSSMEETTSSSVSSLPAGAISTNGVSLFVTVALASLLILIGFSATIRQRKKKLEKELL